ncbi:anthranilate synthase [Klebsiella pneumoniae]|nr:anthranilate synthase [Klebsiella pneumoniae]
MQTSKPALELLTSDAIYRENPTALFHQLCGARPATLLLESADIDSKDDLKSLLLVDSALRITALVTLSLFRPSPPTARRCWNYWTARCPPGSTISASPTAAS